MTKQILLAPVVTEKSMNAVSTNSYTFLVDQHATKQQIAQAVSHQFNVKVLSVSVSVRKGKVKRVGRLRTEVKKQPKKIARVKLAQGQTISLFTVTPEATK
jgi:large subunit ribosomal protein L23